MHDMPSFNLEIKPSKRRSLTLWLTFGLPAVLVVGLLFLLISFQSGIEGAMANLACLLPVDIAAFWPPEEFRAMVAAYIKEIKTGKKAPGVEEILVPGEPEWCTREQRLRDGLDLPDATWQRIVDAGEQCGVAVKL